MIGRGKLWRPDRIGTQIATLVIVAVLVGNAVIAAVFFRFPPGPPPSSTVEMLATVVQLLDRAATKEERASLLRSASQAFPQFALTVDETGGASRPPPPTDNPAIHRLNETIGFGMRVERWNPGDRLEVGIRLTDGTVITAILPHDERGRPPRGQFLWITIMFIVVLTSVLSVWAARGIIAPLLHFAGAAEEFDPDRPQAPLPEQGPEEVRRAAAAFNRMRERIRTLVESRTQMLAAVGHDLRTPITRLRLRAEFVEDEAIRAPLLRDLHQMNAMVQAALSFLRAGQSGRAATRLDLPSILKTICDQFTDAGSDVCYEGPDRCVIDGREDELHRAVTNLVENGIKFGSSVVIRLSLEESTARIDIDDDGPGIPDAEKEAVLKPFVRGDAARSMSPDSGFGLGLSIAYTIAKAHGGALTLIDLRPHGLRSRIELPLRRGPDTGATPSGRGKAQHRELQHKASSA